MNARQYHTEAIRLQNRQIAVNQALGRSPQYANQASSGLAQLERQAGSTASAVQRLAHYSAAGFAGFQLFDMAKRTAVEMSKTAAEIQDVRVRLVGLTQSTQDYNNVEQYLVDLSDKHNKNQLALADSFSRLLTLEKSGIVTRNEAKQVLEGFSNIQSKAGATTEQLKQSLFGLSQGLSSGTLRAEELNQVTEPLPGLLQELDAAAGLTAGGFRKMVNDGKVTSSFFKETLITAFAAYEGAAEATADTITAAHNQHQNAYLQLVKAYETPISDSTKTVLSVSSAAMELFANNVGAVSTLLQGSFVLAMVHGAGAVHRLTIAKMEAVRASKQAKLAAIEESKASQLAMKASVEKSTAARIAILEESQARATAAVAELTQRKETLDALRLELVEQKRAHQVLVSNAVQLKQSNDVKARSVKRLTQVNNSLLATNERLATTEQALTAEMQKANAAQRALEQTNRTLMLTKKKHTTEIINQTSAQRALAGVTMRHTIAMKAQAIAMSALSKASMLLGGLPGMFTLAAFATYQWATSTETARKNSEQLTSAIARTEQQLDSLTQKQLKVRLLTFDEDHGIKQAEDRLRVLKAQEEYNRVQAARGFNNPNNESAKKQAKRDAEIEQLELKLKEASELRQKINDVLSATAKPSQTTTPQTGQSADELSKELAKIEAGLRTQEQVINQSYQRRRDIVEQSLASGQISQAKYNQLTLDLEVQKDEQLRQLESQAQAKKDQAAVNARQLSDQRRKDAQADELAQLRGFKNRLLEEEQLHLDRKRAIIWEQELLALRGFNSRKEAEEYAHLERKQAIIWENELLALQGFQSRKEQQEQAHQDRLRNIQLRNAGQYGGIVQQFVAFDRAAGADRVATGLNIASQLTSITANQSKKAFETNKKVSIAQALVQTYLAATKALASLPPPFNFAAAGVVTAAGLANVAQIRSKKFQGQAHDGIGYVPAANEGTWKLKRGEMVMNPTQRDNFEVLLGYVKQNQKQFDGGNRNSSANSGAVYHFPQMNVEIKNDNSTPALQAENANKMYTLFVNKLLQDLDRRGPVSRAISNTRAA